MVKFICNLTLLLSITYSAIAQQQGERRFRDAPPEERAVFQTERMTEHLELDSTVATKVHEINLKYALQMEEQRGEVPSRFEMMKIIEKANNAKSKEMKEVLSKDQYRKYIRQQQEARERMQQRMGAGPGGPPADNQ